MAAPSVSVHIVTYNQRNYVAETIESALAQDYTDLEIVVSDDGSTDGTDVIVRDYAARHPGRVIALTGGPNLGISGNSNRCLARCRGTYVAFLAGDDLMLPGKVHAQVEWLETDVARVFCAHDVEHFDSATGRTLRLHSSISRPRSGKGAADFLRGGYFSATSSVMVRRAAFPEAGFDERIRVHSDWKFAVECLVAGGKFGYVPGVYGRYRRHDDNATTRYSSLAWEEVHLSIALIEVDYPELAFACQAARAYAYYQRAVSLLQAGRPVESRRAVASALRHYPAVSWKLPFWWALSFIPPGALPPKMRTRLSLGQAGDPPPTAW